MWWLDYLEYFSLLEPTRAWRLTQRKYHATYSTSLTNVTIQGLVFYGSHFVLMPNIICSLRNNHQESRFGSAPSPFLIQCRAQRSLSLLEATMNDDTSDFVKQNVLVKHVCLAIHGAWVWFVATILANELSAYAFRTYGTRYRGSILASTHLDVL